MVDSRDALIAEHLGAQGAFRSSTSCVSIAEGRWPCDLQGRVREADGPEGLHLLCNAFLRDLLDVREVAGLPQHASSATFGGREGEGELLRPTCDVHEGWSAAGAGL